MCDTQRPLATRSFKEKAVFPLISDVLKNRSATVSVMFAVSMLALVPAIGVAVDCSRVVEFKSAMQNAVDNAALAGASAYTDSTQETIAQTTAAAYMTKAIAGMPQNTGITSPTPVTAVLTYAGATSGYTVQVQATGAIPTIFMQAVMGTMSVTVKATAENPIKTAITQNLNPSSNASDNNIIYMYKIPLDNSLPQQSDLKMIYNNDPTQAALNPSSVTLTFAASQNVGFALKNTTGGLHSYGSNGYGGAVGSVHWMYSQNNPPSKNAYSSVSQNCAMETKDITSNAGYTGAAPTSGSCFSTKAGAYTQNLALDCTKNAGRVIRYYWNDMGGPHDDHDYNDAAYSVMCQPTPGGGPTGVALIQ